MKLQRWLAVGCSWCMLNPHYLWYCQVLVHVCVTVCKLLWLWGLSSFTVEVKTADFKWGTIECHHMCITCWVCGSHLLFLKGNECITLKQIKEVYEPVYLFAKTVNEKRFTAPVWPCGAWPIHCSASVFGPLQLKLVGTTLRGAPNYFVKSGTL